MGEGGGGGKHLALFNSDHFSPVLLPHRVYIYIYIYIIKTSGLLANFQQYKKAFKSAISRRHASRLLCSIYQLIS